MHRIINSELIENIYGEWPSFHDFEIHELKLSRDSKEANLELIIHIFKVSPEVNETCCFPLTDHNLVTIKFKKIDKLCIANFNHENSLFFLEIKETETKKFAINIEAGYGVWGEFMCDSIIVVDVKPYIGNPEINCLRTPVCAKSHWERMHDLMSNIKAEVNKYMQLSKSVLRISKVNSMIRSICPGIKKIPDRVKYSQETDPVIFNETRITADSSSDGRQSILTERLQSIIKQEVEKVRFNPEKDPFIQEHKRKVRNILRKYYWY